MRGVVTNCIFVRGLYKIQGYPNYDPSFLALLSSYDKRKRMDQQEVSDIQALLPLLSGVAPIQFLAIASFTLFIYDHALTFDDEVGLFSHIEGAFHKLCHSIGTSGGDRGQSLGYYFSWYVL